jgi:hypothetical protein
LENGKLVAIKEIPEEFGNHEYKLLKKLKERSIDCVTPLAVVTNRYSKTGEKLIDAFVTEHYPYSMPYRAVLSQYNDYNTLRRLADALVLLLVKLHLVGFYWGDVSLSNVLFVRDASEFKAILVDAETGRLYDSLTDAQRVYDVDLARTNIIGELMDLQAGGFVDENFDAVEYMNKFVERYYDFWTAVNFVQYYAEDEQYKIEEKVTYINSLGFDVDQMDLEKTEKGLKLDIVPKVTSAGYYAARLMRLTGLAAHEQQARRIINDIEQYKANNSKRLETDEMAAYDWMHNVFQKTVSKIPNDIKWMRADAQFFHEVLEHRWFLSQEKGADVPLPEATESYIKTLKG